MNLSIFKISKNSFEGQLPEEETLFLLRSHPFVLINNLLIYMGALFILLLLAGVGLFLDNDFLGKIIVFFVSLGFMFWWFGVFYVIMMYLLNVWIVTNRRIISSYQKGLFKRRIAELGFDKIQDLSADYEGFWETTLNFGDLEIQSAAAEKKILMKNIPNPSGVKNEISRLFGK